MLSKSKSRAVGRSPFVVPSMTSPVRIMRDWMPITSRRSISSTEATSAAVVLSRSVFMGAGCIMSGSDSRFFR